MSMKNSNDTIGNRYVDMVTILIIKFRSADNRMIMVRHNIVSPVGGTVL
jgi:hypothetical protein